MGDNDILGKHGGGPHMNFETMAPNPAKPGKMQVIDNMHIYFDQQMLDDYQIQTFHPNDNTKTIFFAMDACFTILKSQGYDYQIIDL